MRFDVVVIGAGAAGLFCAIEAGKRGRSVAVLEHAERAGKKILISGGGRCNFTNLHCAPENFSSANPHFCKSALARYSPQDFLTLVEKHGIAWHEKTLGQLFCDTSAREITAMLERECAAAGVRIFASHKVIGVDRGFTIATSRGEFESAALVLATGGVSIPKIGATDLGYRVARQFGLKVRQPFPALVPLTLSEEDRARYCDLSGVAVEVVASCEGQRFLEKMLITHRGFSGPAILQISSYWRKGLAVSLDLAPGVDVAEGDGPRKYLPKRLADRVVEIAGAEWADRIHNWSVAPAGTEGFDKAEVTGGGVDTGELSSKTFEARKARGLYFVGEVVDVTGHLGGFNFQWAWSSGFCAGQFC
jgi:predicted Rossmann fold flavoprotein